MNVLSLFDGISCGRLALNKSGIKVDNYYSSEIDKYAITVTKNNWPKTIHVGDIEKWREWDINWSSIDLLIGGSPCQGFSFAGGQLAFKDPRSILFFTYVEILNHIKNINPCVKFLLENVKMKKEYLDVISSYLGVHPVFINSALLSAQNRQRYYWSNWEIKQPNDNNTYISDVLIDNGSAWIKNRGVYYSRSKKSTCIDANYFKGVDNHGQRTVVKIRSMIGRKINPITHKRDDYNPDIKITQRIEVRNDSKSGCLTTVQKDNLVCNKDGYRKLTPVECERLQTIPDNYTNYVSNTQRYKMIGNGWTIDIIVHIFKSM